MNHHEFTLAKRENKTHDSSSTIEKQKIIRMKTLNIKTGICALGCALLLGLVLLFSCKRENLTRTTTTDVNITGYFDLHPDQFSEFSKILERSGTASFLGAYGKYTIFAPTNEAVKTYLQSVGKTSVEEVDPTALKDLVRLHVILDTVSTQYFKDGKLQQLTMYGQYLLTGAANVGGVTRYTINKQANVIQANILTGNGLIHVLDKVLTPASQTLAQMIEADPKYSIFTEALKATKFYDTLNVLPENAIDTSRRFLTIIAETDEVFKAANINSFAQLKQRYSTLNDPANPADSLWLFVAYHISPNARYLADIVTASSHPTLAPQEIITSKLDGQTILINDDEFNGVHEPGLPIDRALSDNTAQNGVLHTVTQNYAIKVRNATPVYFDVADQPELMRLPTFRKPGSPRVSIGSMTSICADIIFDGNPKVTLASNYFTTNDPYVNGDGLSLTMGGTSARHQWIEFRTPMLVKGTYKVWVCYRRGATASQVTIDAGTPQEQVMPNIVNFVDYLNVSGVLLADPNSDNLYEAQGYKRYAGSNSNGDNKFVGRLAGTVQIQTTDRHRLRFTRVAGDGTDVVTLDMIQFIPVGMDQQYPRFNRDGSRLERP